MPPSFEIRKRTASIAGEEFGRDRLRGGMHMRHRPAAAILLAALTALFVGQAAGAHTTQRNTDAVFVQTNELSGNRVVVYDRAKDGALTPAGSYATGGLGRRGAGNRDRSHRVAGLP